MKNKLIIGALICLGTAATSVAQDAGFSQINSIPLLLSPANTGGFKQDWRTSGVFRNTSYAAGQTFTTGAFTVEKRIKTGGAENDADRLGIGAFGLFDQSNGGALKSNYIGLSTAYAKALNVSGTSRLSAGLQGVWATRRLDLNKLTFEDQFTSGGFEGGSASADAYRGAASAYLDVNAGLAYELTNEKNGFGLGAALYHAGKPEENFWGDDTELPVRYTFSANTYFTVADNDRFHLSAVTNFQGHADECLLGAYLSKHLQMESSNLRLNIGSYYRLKSAVIPYVGIESRNWSGGLTYDVASGSIREGAANRRSLEIAVAAFF
jgi:type IX secretion system PorP/SprF family membrane protein